METQTMIRILEHFFYALTMATIIGVSTIIIVLFLLLLRGKRGVERTGEEVMILMKTMMMIF